MDTPSTIRTDGAVATDTIECCCHRADCSYTRQYRDTLDRLEREAALAGEAGLVCVFCFVFLILFATHFSLFFFVVLCFLSAALCLAAGSVRPSVGPVRSPVKTD